MSTTDTVARLCRTAERGSFCHFPNLRGQGRGLSVGTGIFTTLKMETSP